VNAGVPDYFRPPFSLDDVRASIRRCLERSEKRLPVHTSGATPTPMGGNSLARQAVKTAIARSAATDSTVLITGETGTGKELIAYAIQAMSRRQQKLFVDLNCAAISDNLLESELFGSERGAFTGANTVYEGKLRLANSGAIFFDAIGDMSPYAQAKILRVIESRQVQSLGNRKTHPVDIRIVTALFCAIVMSRGFARIGQLEESAQRRREKADRYASVLLLWEVKVRNRTTTVDPSLEEELQQLMPLRGSPNVIKACLDLVVLGKTSGLRDPDIPLRFTMMQIALRKDLSLATRAPE